MNGFFFLVLTLVGFGVGVKSFVMERGIEAIELKIEMDDATWDSLTNSQKLSVLKTILRREVLKKRLGE